MDELGVINSPECIGELNQLRFTEQVLRLFLVHDQAFFGQGIPSPLIEFRSAFGNVRFHFGMHSHCIPHIYPPH